MKKILTGGLILSGTCYAFSDMDYPHKTSYRSCNSHMLLHQDDNLWSLGNIQKNKDKFAFNKTFNKIPCYISSGVSSYGCHENTIVYTTTDGVYGIGECIPIEKEGEVSEIFSDVPIKIELTELIKNYLINKYDYTINNNNISSKIKYIINETICNKIIQCDYRYSIPRNRKMIIINDDNIHYVVYYEILYATLGPNSTIIIEEYPGANVIHNYGIGLVDLNNWNNITDIYSPLRKIPKYKYIYDRYISKYINSI